jgi:hypothetical protein
MGKGQTAENYRSVQFVLVELLVGYLPNTNQKSYYWANFLGTDNG